MRRSPARATAEPAAMLPNAPNTAKVAPRLPTSARLKPSSDCKCAAAVATFPRLYAQATPVTKTTHTARQSVCVWWEGMLFTPLSQVLLMPVREPLGLHKLPDSVLPPAR